MIGKTLAHYEVTGQLGKGGMGEVYRAHDTKLGREVALKILPAEFATDSERLARFEREAKVLASLHHPNIASIFGFETLEDCTFLVMELVEGEDLAQVLKRGPLPVDEAVDVARQIAEGLEEAHEKGIIHRDLKPANVKRTADGKVKVLDFGLARAFSGQTAGEEQVSSAPTMTAAMTQVGTVMGTAAYMSPEQARGKEVDRRTDIWAFGVLLFEMLTGKQLFMGETASDTLAGILKSEPDWDRLPADMPFQVERVLRRCLAKDPRQRLRDIGEARVRLEDPAAESGVFSTQMAAVAGNDGRARRFAPWTIALAATMAAVFFGLSGGDPHPQANRIPYRFEMRHPRGSDPIVSPDGRRFAFVDDNDGEEAIWVQSFAETEGRLLKGPEEPDSFLMWSPDGHNIAYFKEETLEMVSADGGSPRTICRLPRGWRIGDWSANGVILVEVMLNPEANGWYLCHVADGSVEKIERPLELESGQTRAWPVFLPDGEHFLFTHYIDGARQAVLSHLCKGGTEVLFPTDTRVLVSDDGWYLFSRRGQVLAQAFDPETFRPVGETRILADDVNLFVPNGRLSLSSSDEGTIVYQTFASDRELVWYDREGRRLDSALESRQCRDVRLSPDGRQLVLVINDPRSGTGDLWIHDLERDLTTPLTDTPWAEFSPVWSPDGDKIVYSADASGPPNLFFIGINGDPAREVTPMDLTVQYPTDWLADDDLIVFQRSSAETGLDVWIVPAAGGEPREILRSEYSEFSAVVSPDGAWLAYNLRRESGRTEVFVKPFSGDGPAQRVSIEGGFSPAWDGNGRLFFRGPEETLLEVDLVEENGRLHIGRPRTVLALPDLDMVEFDLHPDGRILVTFDPRPRDHSVSQVIVNWER